MRAYHVYFVTCYFTLYYFEQEESERKAPSFKSLKNDPGLIKMKKLRAVVPKMKKFWKIILTTRESGTCLNVAIISE